MDRTVAWLLLGVAALTVGCAQILGIEDILSYCNEQNAEQVCGPDAFCDIDGIYAGSRNTCVPKVSCESHAACESPGMPICDSTAGTCRKCMDDIECMARDSNAPTCMEDGTCGVVGCSDSGECPPGTPICDGTACVPCTASATGDEDCAARDSEAPICMPTGTCGACQQDAHCPPEAPICNMDAGTCRTCEANSECASQVCDKQTGQCAAPSEVLYVNGAEGDDTSPCDRLDNACKTINAALLLTDGTRRYVRIERLAAGVYQEVLSIAGKEVILVSNDATLQPVPAADDNKSVITIGDGTTVAIQGLQIKLARGSTGNGIRCSSSTMPASLRLTEVIVAENANLGIDTFQCALTVERSTIAKNNGGGILVTRSAFSITNSFIVENGNAGSTAFGGVRIDNPTSITPQRFDFNTVARNQARSTGDATGVRCSTTTPMTASSNIVHGGVGDPASISGDCTWTYSNIEKPGSVTLNPTNISEDPLFVDSAGGNYHLLPESPCRNAGDPSRGITIDFDGDSRPQGAAPDIGADEIRIAM